MGGERQVNSFTVAVKGFATVYFGIINGLVRVWQEMADALGAEKIAEKLKGATDYLGALTKAFANQTAEDANDVKDSLVGIYDSFAEKSEAAAKKVSKTVKTMTNNQKLLWQHYADEVVDRQKKVQEVFTNTSDTAKNAFKDVTDAMAQVSSAETRVELASLGGNTGRSIKCWHPVSGGILRGDRGQPLSNCSVTINEEATAGRGVHCQ